MTDDVRGLYQDSPAELAEFRRKAAALAKATATPGAARKLLADLGISPDTGRLEPLKETT